MQSAWRLSLVQRLCAQQRDDGAWSYRPSGMPAAEATSLAALALLATEQEKKSSLSAMRWLSKQQRTDGAVAAMPGAPSAWTTALALLVWDHSEDAEFEAERRRAIEWLLKAAGLPAHQAAKNVSHDTELIGWSWAPATHSWVEPTAFSILALRGAGFAGHTRVREGVRLILNRALPDGGWNYGNSQVLGNTLRPFPETTGLALAALAGEPREPTVDRSADFLLRELPRIRAPLSLGWGLIGLSLWESRPKEADGWLAEAAADILDCEFFAPHDALLLLAGAPQIFQPSTPTRAEASHG